MRKDPILEEIHRVRAAHAKRFNYDLRAICEDIKRRQTRHKNLVDLSGSATRQAGVAEKGESYGTDR